MDEDQSIQQCGQVFLPRSLPSLQFDESPLPKSGALFRTDALVSIVHLLGQRPDDLIFKLPDWHATATTFDSRDWTC